MIQEPSFRRVLGPVKDILKRNMDLYKGYEEIMTSTESMSPTAVKGLHGAQKRERRKRVLAMSGAREGRCCLVGRSHAEF